ncbi:hypothetical protein OHT59_32125 [Streptomyces sp. NBC_00243]|uniref:hypothetical protein n=1 Tax=Streptomyces sp. NBC_00243 TaxID=2975688 RepID=UPI002DD99E9C|nr:hypothetical protein [Streptomyces sp. NBC_00243]WRZ22796.1 hypothetical protein OHT59_32125 [Streptomyces sp. NBC_00243]
MAVESHGHGLVPVRTGHRAKSPKSLRDRAPGRGERLALRDIQRPEHQGPISPDGSSLFADASEVFNFRIADRPRGGPLSKKRVEASWQPPKAKVAPRHCRP